MYLSTVSSAKFQILGENEKYHYSQASDSVIMNS